MTPHGRAPYSYIVSDNSKEMVIWPKWLRPEFLSNGSNFPTSRLHHTFSISKTWSCTATRKTVEKKGVTILNQTGFGTIEELHKEGRQLTILSQIYFAAKQPQFLNLDGRNFLTGSAAHCFCHSFHLPHLDVWKLTQQVAAQNDGGGENQTKPNIFFFKHLFVKLFRHD